MSKARSHTFLARKGMKLMSGDVSHRAAEQTAVFPTKQGYEAEQEYFSDSQAAL
jgi:hypothetical protein